MIYQMGEGMGANQFLPLANEVWDKVMFLHMSVILFTGGGVFLTEPPWTEAPWTKTLRTETPPGQNPPPRTEPLTPGQGPPWTMGYIFQKLRRNKEN